MSEATGAIAERPETPDAASPQCAAVTPALSSVGVFDTAVPVRSTWSIAQTIASTVIGRLSTKGALAVVDQAIVSGTSFATSIFIGRLCSKEEFGIYYLALSIVLFVRGVQENIVSAPYMIYCHRRRGRKLAAYAGSSLAHQLVLSGVTLIGLAALAAVLSMGVGPTALAPVIWVLLGAAPLLLLREFIRQFSFAHLHLGTAVVIDVVVAVLQLGSLLLLGYFGSLSAVTIYAAMGGACAVAVGGWFLAKRQPIQLVRARCIADWWHNWVFAKWALASHLLGCTAPYLLPWVLVLVCGEAETGVLAACATLVGVGYMFVTGVANYLTPRAAKAFTCGGVGELSRVLWKTAALFTVTLGAFCLLVLLTGDLLAVLVYGTKYTGVGVILSILAFGALVNAIGLTAGNGLWAMERPSANFIADVCSLSVMLIAAFCLVQPFGVLGVAIAEFGGMLAGSIVRLITLFRLMAAFRMEPAV